MSPVPGEPAIDTTKPNMARVYDYMIGGTLNYPPDRAVAARLVELYEGMPLLMRENRAFLVKATEWLVRELGITQFLDLGAGLPTSPSVHQAARSADPDARVVYVDSDPAVICHTRARLAAEHRTPQDTARGRRVAIAKADLTNPSAVLTDPLVTSVLDFTRPVAVLLGAVVHFMGAAESAALTAAYMERMVPGSALVLTSAWYSDRELNARIAAAYKAGTWTNHTRAEVTGMIPPGCLLVRDSVGDVATWPVREVGPPGHRERKATVLGGVAVKTR